MGGSVHRTYDPAEDRAVALLRDLETHKTDEPQIAEPMARLSARLIDVVVWLLLGFGWSIVTVLLDNAFWADPLGQPGPAGEAPGPIDRIHPTASWIGLAGLLATICALEAIPTARTGMSLSKRRLGLRVVGPSGEPADWWRSAVRLLAWTLPAIVGVALWGTHVGTDSAVPFVGIAIQLAALAAPGSMFLTADHRGLHDRLAGTRVLADR